MVHEVRSVDGAVTNGVHQLSSSEVEELLHKADEVTMNESSKTTPRLERGQAEKVEKVEKDVAPAATPMKDITGVETKPAAPQTEVGGASTENPVTMVFMGYQSVDDEDETKKVLGMESTTVKAEVVLIEDGDAKTASCDTKQEQAPPNGSPAEPPKAEEAASESEQPEGGAAEVKSKEKQPCKCCTIMWAQIRPPKHRLYWWNPTTYRENNSKAERNKQSVSFDGCCCFFNWFLPVLYFLYCFIFSPWSSLTSFELYALFYFSSLWLKWIESYALLWEKYEDLTL